MGLKSSVSDSPKSLTQHLPAEVPTMVESATIGDLDVEPDVIDTDLAGNISETTSRPDCPKDEEPASRSPESSRAPSPDTSSTEHSTQSTTVPLEAPQLQPFRRTYPGRIGMPTSPMNIPSASFGSSSLADLALNSPSSQIIGTPFTTSGSPTRFEYPFPDSPSPQTDSSGASPNLMLSGRPSMAYPGSNYYSHSPSPPPLSPIANSASFFSLSQSSVLSQGRSASVPPPARSGNVGDGYLAKLRAQAAAPPPIPPSLSKKIGQELLSRQNAAAGSSTGESSMKKVEEES